MYELLRQRATQYYMCRRRRRGPSRQCGLGFLEPKQTNKHIQLTNRLHMRTQRCCWCYFFCALCGVVLQQQLSIDNLGRSDIAMFSELSAKVDWF